MSCDVVLLLERMQDVLAFWWQRILTVYFPEGPFSAHVRTLVPRTIPGIVFGTQSPEMGRYMDPLGFNAIATAWPR